MNWLRARATDRQTDKQTDRLTDRQRHRQTDRWWNEAGTRKGRESSVGTLSLVENPGAMLTWIRVPDAARDFPPRVNSLTVSVQPPVCDRMHRHQCARFTFQIKKKKNCSHTIVWTHTKILQCTHWQEQVPLFFRQLCLQQVRRHEFPASDNGFFSWIFNR